MDTRMMADPNGAYALTRLHDRTSNPPAVDQPATAEETAGRGFWARLLDAFERMAVYDQGIYPLG